MWDRRHFFNTAATDDNRNTAMDTTAPPMDESNGGGGDQLLVVDDEVCGDQQRQQPPVGWHRRPPGVWHHVPRLPPIPEDNGWEIDEEQKDAPHQFYHRHPPPPPPPPFYNSGDERHYQQQQQQHPQIFAYKKLSSYAKAPTPAVWGGFYLHSAHDYKIPARGGRAYVLTDLELVPPLGCFMTVHSRLGPSLINGLVVGETVHCYQGNAGVMMYNLSDRPFYVSQFDPVAILTLHRAPIVNLVRLDDRAPIPRVPAPAQAFYDRLMREEFSNGRTPIADGDDGWGSGWLELDGAVSPGETRFHVAEPKGFYFRRPEHLRPMLTNTSEWGDDGGEGQ